jgi:pantothenate kinase
MSNHVSRKTFQYYDVAFTGVHRKLRHYIIDNGRRNLDYFIAHLSHEVYKSHGERGHDTRQEIRRDLKKSAEKILINIRTVVQSRRLR